MSLFTKKNPELKVLSVLCVPLLRSALAALEVTYSLFMGPAGSL